MRPRIEVQGLGKRFDGARSALSAVTDVSFAVSEGEFVCLLGPSGCGKSTVLRILAGLETATEGTVRILSERADRPPTAMVFQEQSLFPWMTVIDNVGVGLLATKLPRARMTEIATALLGKVGLSGFLHHYPHQLSGGMKQRVAIARALAADPEVLLMDEPFAALDEQNKILLQEELLRIWEESRKTIVYVTHSLDEALFLGDRIFLITAAPGRIKAVVDVNFARPRRHADIKQSRQYGELYGQLWSHLESEVAASRSLAR